MRCSALMCSPTRTLIAATTMLAGAPASHATWSILLMDTESGEIAVGSATCLTDFDLLRSTPVMVAGVGAATAQSFVDTGGFNRTRVLTGLVRGSSPGMILDGLAAADFGHQTRQYGLVSVDGPLTFTGTQAGAFADGLVGVLPDAGPTGGDLFYAIQGNVLTGEPVLTTALTAIKTTPGPLTDRLMAAMEASRDAGGDGRCSCNQGGPTACGPTPDVFEKSADIGYVIATRAGDTDRSRLAYQISGEGSPRVTAQIGDDGRIRRVVTRRGTTLELFEAVAGPLLTSAAALDPIGEFIPPGGFISFEGFADRADGSGALVTVGGSAVRIVPIAATGGALGLENTIEVQVPAAGVWALDDFDRDGVTDLAGLGFLSAWIAYGIDGPVQTFDVPGFVVGAAASGGDLFALSTAGSVLKIPASASRSPGVAESADAPISAQVVAGDFDGDGQSEAVFATPANELVLFSPGAVPPTRVLAAPSSTPTSLSAGDANGDGLDDLYVSSSSAGLILFNDPVSPGVFTSSTFPVVTGASALLGDLGGDGVAELVTATNSVLRVFPGTQAGPSAVDGYANGDMYLRLNVAFAKSEDPDPVDQLRDQYDAWRAGLAGVPDGILSTLTIDRNAIGATDACSALLTATLIDLDGMPVTGVLPDDLVVVSSQLGIVEAGQFSLVGDGVFEAVVGATGGVGTRTLGLVVDVPGGRPVTLTEGVEISAELPADIDGNGRVEGADFNAWLTAFLLGDPAADLTGNGQLDLDDFDAWLESFLDPCG
ncbi:MAG: DUF1028 domain-containing protein [Planctomycetota bacterium]